MTASTSIITDLAAAIATGPSATSLANAADPTKKIQDLKGNLDLALTKAKELKFLLQEADVAIDSGDGIQASITNILSSLS